MDGWIDRHVVYLYIYIYTESWYLQNLRERRLQEICVLCVYIVYRYPSISYPFVVRGCLTFQSVWFEDPGIVIIGDFLERPILSIFSNYVGEKKASLKKSVKHIYIYICILYIWDFGSIYIYIYIVQFGKTPSPFTAKLDLNTLKETSWWIASKNMAYFP